MPLLRATDDFVLGLPVAAVLAQRFRLPTVDPAEFPEMIRIQIEKALPFSADEVTTDFEVIEQTESGSVVSAVAIKTNSLPRSPPLLEHGYIPRQVTVYTAQRAAILCAARKQFYLSRRRDACSATEHGKLSLPNF